MPKIRATIQIDEEAWKTLTKLCKRTKRGRAEFAGSLLEEQVLKVKEKVFSYEELNNSISEEVFFSRTGEFFVGIRNSKACIIRQDNHGDTFEYYCENLGTAEKILGKRGFQIKVVSI